ncbi:MAG: VanZ family protein [Limnohabitans sp.]|nr:MAG: VanZ family protein [Limnohabitans sp.]
MNYRPLFTSRPVWPARLWWLALLLVLVLALLPGRYLQSPVFNWWDKAQHAAAFAVLAWWGMRCWPGRGVWVLAGLVFFGTGIEGLQHASGWRHGDWADVMADVCGLFVGYTCHRVFRPRKA